VTRKSAALFLKKKIKGVGLVVEDGKKLKMKVRCDYIRKLYEEVLLQTTDRRTVLMNRYDLRWSI